jgi:hypothetical protein
VPRLVMVPVRVGPGGEAPPLWRGEKVLRGAVLARRVAWFRGRGRVGARARARARIRIRIRVRVRVRGKGLGLGVRG